MKLKVFNQHNSKAAKSGERKIHFSKKSGLIGISKTATEELGIKEGDKLLLAQDEENPCDWFLAKTTDDEGFALRLKSGSSAFNCSSLVSRVLDSLKIEQSAGFYNAKNPQKIEGKEYYLILTSKPLNAK